MGKRLRSAIFVSFLTVCAVMPTKCYASYASALWQVYIGQHYATEGYKNALWSYYYESQAYTYTAHLMVQEGEKAMQTAYNQALEAYLLDGNFYGYYGQYYSYYSWIYAYYTRVYLWYAFLGIDYDLQAINYANLSSSNANLAAYYLGMAE